MRRSVWLALGTVLIGLSLAVILGGGLTRGATAQPREVTFIDQRTNLALRVQVETNAPNAGAFVFRVPGRGVYVGQAGTAMQVPSLTNIIVQFQGPAALQPDVSLSDPSGSGGASTTVTITLQATLDATRHTGQAVLIDGAASFSLLAIAVVPPDITPVLQAVETATVSGDWATVYSYMNSDVITNAMPSDFATQMNQTNATLGPITALRRVAVGPAQTDDQGITSLVVTYQVDRLPSGGPTTTTTYDAHFLLQGGAWKVWYMDVR